jgi:hypothetical protein
VKLAGMLLPERVKAPFGHLFLLVRDVFYESGCLGMQP